jgi:hypothetical protein
MRTQFLNDGIADWLRTTRKGIATELVNWEFHHYRTFTPAIDEESGDFIPLTLPNDLTFFNIAAGQVLSGGDVATKEDCNLFKASSIGYPYKYLTQEVGFYLEPAGAEGVIPRQPLGENEDNQWDLFNDLKQLLVRGVSSFETLQKTYFELCPPMQMPAGIGQVGGVSVANSEGQAGGLIVNGWPVKSNRFHCEIPLDEETQFNMFMRYPKGPVTIKTPITMGFILGGILQRPKV